MRPIDTNIYSLNSQDFTEMEQALSAWDHQYRQISPGKFHGSLFHTQTGELGIFRNRWERAIHYKGVAPQGTIALAISLIQTGDARWMGRRVGFDDLILQRSGKEAEYLSAPLWDSVVFAIPEAELTQQITNITRDNPRKFLTHGVVRLRPRPAAQIRRAAMDFLNTASSTVVIPGVTSTLPQMAGSMVELVACALVSSKPRRHEKACLTRQRQLIARAEDYVKNLKNQPLRIGHLCDELDAKERTLHHAFHNLSGMSPLAYLKTEQLNRVFRVFHDAEPTDTLVKQVAMEHGFNHAGQFSRDYKQLFGELPSATLQRCNG